MTEFEKLENMLNESNIPYVRFDDAGFNPFGCNMKRIHYPTKTDFVCSVIFGHGSYGHENGLLEIMGLLTPEEEKYDRVVGYLTADEVFKRIKNHWESKGD